MLGISNTFLSSQWFPRVIILLSLISLMFYFPLLFSAFSYLLYLMHFAGSCCTYTWSTSLFPGICPTELFPSSISIVSRQSIQSILLNSRSGLIVEENLPRIPDIKRWARGLFTIVNGWGEYGVKQTQAPKVAELSWRQLLLVRTSTVRVPAHRDFRLAGTTLRTTSPEEPRD